MFFFFSKTLSFLITPLAWILISVTFAFMTNKSGRRKKRNFVAFFILIFFTNPWLANKAIHTWEVPPQSISQGQYDIVVVLSGMTYPELTLDPQVQFNASSERFIEPLRLYHQEKISKILISGGSGSFDQPELKETPALRELALQLKVNDTDVLIETESRNTFENAKFSAEILNSNFNNPKVLLVTSASHMKRAMACFKKQGIDASPYPVDFQGNPNHIPFLKEAVPSQEALRVWTTLLHEWFGYLTYWVVGYI